MNIYSQVVHKLLIGIKIGKLPLQPWGMRMERNDEDTIQLINFGRQDCSDLHSWGPGMRPCYILHYVIRGSGNLIYGNRLYHITTGESFLTAPYTEIRYYPDPDDPWEYTWVDFTGREAGSYLQKLGLTPSRPVYPVIAPERILPVYERLKGLDIYHNNKREAGGILLLLIGIYADSLPVDAEDDQRQEDKRLETAVMLIHSHYHHPDFNIETLCGMMFINRVTLYRLFRKHLDTSPNSYLVEYRIMQACRMLKMGMSVKHTSISCGFSDQFYFSRIFRQHTGEAPSRYGKYERRKEFPECESSPPRKF